MFFPLLSSDLVRHLRRVVEKVVHGAKEAGAEVMIATHNQNSVEHAVSLMHALDLPPGDTGVFFGQLLGMSDPLTYVLGGNGYKVGAGGIASIRLVISMVVYILVAGSMPKILIFGGCHVPCTCGCSGLTGGLTVGTALVPSFPKGYHTGCSVWGCAFAMNGQLDVGLRCPPPCTPRRAPCPPGAGVDAVVLLLTSHGSCCLEHILPV